MDTVQIWIFAIIAFVYLVTFIIKYNEDHDSIWVWLNFTAVLCLYLIAISVVIQLDAMKKGHPCPTYEKIEDVYKLVP